MRVESASSSRLELNHRTRFATRVKSHSESDRQERRFCAGNLNAAAGANVKELRMSVFRLALVTDVHGDVHALTDALAQIDRLACEQIVCCGDVADYGLFPDETVAHSPVGGPQPSAETITAGRSKGSPATGEGNGTYRGVARDSRRQVAD